uniref:CSON004498 protein n=1 Tax=Culicoides sonorensis TaxID=179676 RepID=A0A336MRC9_CULSO
MSWLKFTDNLTKIKDEVANFATEVLAPDLPPDEAGAQALDPNEMKKKEISEQQIQELTNLCATQDAELTTLRRQIAELQQSQQIKSIEASISGSSSKPNTKSLIIKS